MSLEQNFSDTCRTNRATFLTIARSNLPERIRRDAEDVVQESLLQAWAELSGFRGDCSLESFIALIIKRTAWKWSARHEPILSIYEPDYCSIPGVGVNVEQSLCVDQVLRMTTELLSVKQRAFLWRWRAGEFDGEMDQSANRNMLRSIRLRVRSIAIRKRIA